MEEYVVVDTEDEAGPLRWRFERSFLASRWRCQWGHACQGILDHPAPELQQGCCSVGAELVDDDEARMVAALAALLGPAELEQHRYAGEHGVFADEQRRHTAVVDGACVFFNRPGFAGGTGCALHLAAVARDEPVVDWKPAVCWQLPLRVDWEEQDGRTTSTVRRWRRDDWGAGGRTMAWWCTEAPEAFDADRPVLETLAAELEELAGHEVVVELRRRW